MYFLKEESYTVIIAFFVAFLPLDIVGCSYYGQACGSGCCGRLRCFEGKCGEGGERGKNK